jgi:hypothetical protein
MQFKIQKKLPSSDPEVDVFDEVVVVVFIVVAVIVRLIESFVVES